MEEELTVTREPIKMKRVEMVDMLEAIAESESPIIRDDLVIVNIRGTNGAGKSTVPMKMLEGSRKAFIVVDDGEEVATVIPEYNVVTVGTYRRKTGGLDGIRNTARMKDILEKVKYFDMNILLEGILASTVYSTYQDILNKFEYEHFVTRKAVVFTIVPEFEEIKRRVLKRNGGKEVKWEQVESKYNTVQKNARKFKEGGTLSITADNTGIGIENTVPWFIQELEEREVTWSGIIE